MYIYVCIFIYCMIQLSLQWKHIQTFIMYMLSLRLDTRCTFLKSASLPTLKSLLNGKACLSKQNSDVDENTNQNAMHSSKLPYTLHLYVSVHVYENNLSFKYFINPFKFSAQISIMHQNCTTGIRWPKFNASQSQWITQAALSQFPTFKISVCIKSFWLLHVWIFNDLKHCLMNKQDSAFKQQNI